jgi:hypothetical protein
VKSLPMREAAMFKSKNMKWTAGDYKMYADAHANSLLEYRMKKGDKVVVWMEACHHKVLITIFELFNDLHLRHSSLLNNPTYNLFLTAFGPLGLRQNGHDCIRCGSEDIES